MTSEEIAIEEVALEFVRVNRSSLARQVVDTHLFAPEESPIAVFMCGSPGAGKTEISKALVELFESAEADQRVLRIDPDDFRLLIPGYTGANSYLFQRAVTRVLEKVLDRVFEKSVSFILDGTMASFSVAKRNIDRALAHNRVVQVLYVYQAPELAWQFVKARELVEARNIPLDEFVRQFLAARKNIAEIRRSYGAQLVVNLIIKNTDGAQKAFVSDVTPEQIDDLIPQSYDHEQLIELLTEAEKNDCQ